MHLLVDIGNSRVKWATAQASALAGPFGFARPRTDDPAAAYARAWADLCPTAITCCSVVGRRATDAFADWARHAWGVSPAEVRAVDRQGPLVNGYRDPGTLGADRWANLFGARALLGAVDTVVVDAGTAVTIDGLRADGRHTGGAILAGLAATRSGLRSAAPALPAPADSTALPADSTEGALGAGTLLGLAGAVDAVARRIAGALDAPRWVIAGGDAERILPWLEPGWQHDPLLTLRGLLAAGEATCAP